MKNKIKKPLVENNVTVYHLKNDKKMIGVILLIIISAFQIFAFLNVPVLTTIHAYTAGMLFGVYNPLFYAYAAYLSIIMIFGDKVAMPTWIKLGRVSYWFVAVAVIFIGSSSGYIQNTITDGWTGIGVKSLSAMSKWFEIFTSGNVWFPSNINGGLLGWFLFSITSAGLSGIGSLIFAVMCLVVSVSLLVTGTWIGFYKTLIKRKETDDDDAIEPTNEIDLSQFENNEQTKTGIIVQNTPVEPDVNDLPFEDPFA